MTDAHRRQRLRAFTLIELMTVVAIVAVLAVLGVVSYRKFISSARTGEAIYMVGSIRSAEESYKAETLTYLNVTASFAAFYPSTTPGKFKTAWDVSHPDRDAWRQLGARSDGPVMYGYKVAAGAASGTLPALDVAAPPSTWVAPAEAWYVIEAQGDVDANGIKSSVVGTSWTGELYIENEGE
jgi:prepilin-type N-terminal cleavage/methylation domain-containing protein